MTDVKLELIGDNPYQPRTTDNLEHIENLARSIAADGLLQVPTAIQLTDGSYQLAFGHSRRKAFEWLQKNWFEQGLPDRYEAYTVMPVLVSELSDEEMYRCAVAENVQRKDLDAIETAKAMAVYRDLFSKNSDEIGELFGMTGSTVRGKLRLLDLPEEVKTELAAGTISEGSARDLLSLQKVATTEVLLSAVESIKAGVDKWGSETTPKEIVADVIEELDNVEQMTWRNDDSKKPTVKNDGWALDMKKFPNQYLPVLTRGVIEPALNWNSSDVDGNKLVHQIAEYLDADTATDFDDEYHKANMAQIQTRMEQLAEINPEYSQRLQHLINPPACNVCPFMTKFDDRYFCGIKVCFERKQTAWEKYEMYAKSKKLGVEVYDRERDGNFLVLEDSYRNGDHKTLWEKKSKDLRIAFMADIDRKKYQSGYEGCPRGCVVVVVGKTLEKLSEKKEQEREEALVDMSEVRDEMMRKRIDELLWESTAYLKVLLDGVGDEAVLSLYEAPRYGWSSHNAIPEDFSGNESKAVLAEHTRREVSLWMLLSGEDGVDEDDYETLADLVTAIQKRAKEWKIKIPAEFAKKAAQYDAKIAEAVSAETTKSKKK